MERIIKDTVEMAEEAMLRPAFPHPCPTLRLPHSHPRPPAQCSAAQQPRQKGLKRLKRLKKLKRKKTNGPKAVGWSSLRRPAETSFCFS